MAKNTIIIGIAGASASGKSLLANTIVNELGSDQVGVIPEDAYYKDRSDIPLAERANINYDHPDSLDHDLLCEHLLALQEGASIEMPIYNYSIHARTKQTRSVSNYRIIVLEGILLLAEKKLRDLMDIKIFMDTPLDICLSRRLKRDIVERQRTLECVLDQYHATVRPMYLQFIEPSKRYADVIVPRGGENRIAIDMIKAGINQSII